MISIHDERYVRNGSWFYLIALVTLVPSNTVERDVSSRVQRFPANFIWNFCFSCQRLDDWGKRKISIKIQHCKPPDCITIPTTILHLLQFKKLLKAICNSNKIFKRTCTIHSTISDKSTVCWFLCGIVDDREWEKWWLDLLESVNRESTTIIRLCGLNQLLFEKQRREN